MQVAEKLGHWAHSFHDHSTKAVHYTGHLLHEKSFWGILVVVALLTGLLALIALLGGNIDAKNFTVPYGPYY